VILAGVRILTFTTGIAGPNAGRILAGLGAEVIKVESRKGGIDAFRYFGTSDDVNSSPRFAEANFGVRSLAVDLKRPEGLALVKELVRKTDVVLENFRPDVLDRLGLGFAELRRLRPDIIQVKMPGLGSTGPLKDYGTWGALLNSYTGLTHLWNHPDADVPVGNQGVFPDYLTAVLAPTVVIGALIRRESTGEGCLIDLAQSEATAFCALPISMLEVAINGRDPAPVGNLGRDGAIQGVYACEGDDSWCAIRVESDAEWGALLDVIGRGDLAEDKDLRDREARRQHRGKVDGAISAWTRARPASEVMWSLQGAGVAAGMVASGLDLIVDPQLGRRGFIRRVEQPGVGQMTVPGLPLVIDPPLLEEPGPAPMLGQDNDHIVRGVIGLSEEEQRELTLKEVLV
jgi:crotonobetainyl-CoA:carnitine CoA-transferase CaiB-like acyl-CoA transferase